MSQQFNHTDYPHRPSCESPLPVNQWITRDSQFTACTACGQKQNKTKLFLCLARAHIRRIITLRLFQDFVAMHGRRPFNQL